MSEEKIVNTGMSLYELNKQVMSQLPPQDEMTMAHNWNVIGDWFSKDKERWFMLMCKERSDFTLFHIVDNNFAKGIQELKEVLEERGDILAIQYQHGEDTFEIWIKDKKAEVFLFMLFGASWMIVEV